MIQTGMIQTGMIQTGAPQTLRIHRTRRIAPRVLSLYDSAFTYDEKYMEWVPMGCGGHIG